MTKEQKIQLAVNNRDAAFNLLDWNFEMKFRALPMVGEEVIAEKVLELNAWYREEAKRITEKYVKEVLEA